MNASYQPASSNSRMRVPPQSEPGVQAPRVSVVKGVGPAAPESAQADRPQSREADNVALPEHSSRKSNHHILTEPKVYPGDGDTVKPIRSTGAPIPRGKRPKNVPLAWISAFLTGILLALTAFYALEPDLWESDFVNSSASNAIFVLRALSEATAFLLAVTISSAFELVQWLLTVRSEGIPVPEYLSLHSSTGLLGLMQLTAGPKSRASTRLWSALRLFGVVLLPGLGVLIMSQVEIVLRFNKIGETTAPLGFGLGSMNTSVATSLSPFTDILLGASFSGFLDDPSHAIDITPDASRSRSCSLDADVRGKQVCERAVYLAAGQEQLAAQVTTQAHPQADAWLVETHQGYVLRFSEGNSSWEFANDTECRTYYTEVLTTNLGAFMLCLKNVAPHQIQARVSSCQYSDITTGSCHQASAWNSTPSWTTSLSSTFRQAQIAYSRLNGTIISHEFADVPERVAPLNSLDLLQAWDNFLGLGNDTDSTTASVVSILGLGAGKFLFPAMIGSMLNSITELSEENPALQDRAVNALQALLAIPIYFCQPGYLERTAVSSLPSNILYTSYNDVILPEGLERDTAVFFAVTRNQINVGPATVIAYVVLTGIVLILCFWALGSGTFTARSRNIPCITTFPALDFCLHCVVMTKAGESTARGPFQGIQSYEAADLAMEMDVKLARDLG
ncbi:hypothetical protein PV04_06509 [Phialophora macrospora]|uniref:Uncharacterized protein n=1 Tax=Phialophora macrospora TaxID=1851006 RepID=A0A0D2G5E7_9EURO|nr:hypothetical protein PV04_06509 [Phialophora macrospora]